VEIVNVNVCAESVLDVSCGNCFYLCIDERILNILSNFCQILCILESGLQSISEQDF
jgi:hypothetical protein